MLLEAIDAIEPLESVAPQNQVLVVDDDEGICELGSLMLEHLGHKPVAVSNGESAVSACESGDYDLVLLDLAMPDMSGRQVYDVLRDSARAIPVVFMTGYRTEELAGSLSEDTAVGFLHKPFPLDVLRDTLETLLVGPAHN